MTLKLISRHLILLLCALLCWSGASAAVTSEGPDVIVKHSFYIIDHNKLLLHRECDTTAVSSRKHANALLFLNAIENHPWRVYNISEADLIVLPALFDYYARKRCNKTLSEFDYAYNFRQILFGTGHFPQKRHLVLTEDAMTRSWKSNLKYNYPQLIQTSFDDFHVDCDFSVGYSNHYDVSKYFGRSTLSNQASSSKQSNSVVPSFSLSDHKKRVYLAEFTGQVDGRKGYEDRSALFRDTAHSAYPIFVTAWLANTTGNTMKACHPAPHMLKQNFSLLLDQGNGFDRCITHLSASQTQFVRSQSRFSLCFRGDTLGADRWVNAFLSGSIPVAIEDSLEIATSWAPYQNIIPWKNITVLITRKEFIRSPIKAIEKLAEIPLEDIANRLRLMEKHVADLSFFAEDSRVASNILHTAAVCPCRFYSQNLKLPGYF